VTERAAALALEGASPPEQPLPYGRRLGLVLQPLHRWFANVNRVVVPALDAGLGALISNPVTGYLIVLRTRGRRTGRLRSVPLGYVILDGSIYCCAGFGRSTAWYRNVLADGRVEVVLPGRLLIGRAETVTDPAEWTIAYRALMASLGLVSRLVLGDLRRIDDRTLQERHRAIPVVRITPTGIVAGQLDPGGRFWLLAVGGWLFSAAAVRRLLRSRRSAPDRAERGRRAGRVRALTSLSRP
jgi:deazaflavin-dependent oxidoreductase (nitroreductase family)